MARGMSAADTRALVRRIRRGIPGVAMRTNFIVGFPGETEAEFEELCAYVEEEGFEHVVVFAYEREPETASFAMADPVAVRTRQRRRRDLLALQQRLSRARLLRKVGETLRVMVDGPADAGRPSDAVWAGRTAGQGFEIDGGVRLEGEGLEPGAVVEARVIGAAAYDLFARVERPALVGISGSRR
jgi:tRNA A37 methylthiotransferase MiaB